MKYTVEIIQNGRSGFCFTCGSPVRFIKVRVIPKGGADPVADKGNELNCCASCFAKGGYVSWRFLGSLGVSLQDAEMVVVSS